MKGVIIALLLAGSVSAASAAAKEKASFCDTLSSYAHTTMEARQQGVTMRDTIKIVDRLDLDDPMKELLRDVVEDAYSKPAYQTKAYQRKAVSEFENFWYLSCYKARKPR
jgi:hypothetical protein